MKDILKDFSLEGKVALITGVSYGIGYAIASAYAAAKGGLKMLTRNICSEYGEANIQCNGIGPGYIAALQTAPLRERQADGSQHPFDQFIIAKHRRQDGELPRT